MSVIISDYHCQMKSPLIMPEQRLEGMIPLMWHKSSTWEPNTTCIGSGSIMMALCDRIQWQKLDNAGRSWTHVAMHPPTVIKGMMDTLTQACQTSCFVWQCIYIELKLLQDPGKVWDIDLSLLRSLCHFFTLVCIWVRETLSRISTGQGTQSFDSWVVIF